MSGFVSPGNYVDLIVHVSPDDNGRSRTSRETHTLAEHLFVLAVNGDSVDFSHIVQDGDDISVYPVFESLDIRPLLRLRPEPLRHPVFVLDSHLGRLARYLRLLPVGEHEVGARKKLQRPGSRWRKVLGEVDSL